MPDPVAIIGVHQTPYRADVSELSLEESIFQAVHRTLEDADLSLGDIESVVIASADLVDGRVISSMVTSGPAGCYWKDLLNVSSSGEHGLSLGCMRVASGLFRTSLVLTWGRSSEGPLDLVDTYALEPFYSRPVGVNSAIAGALQAQDYRQRYTPPEEVGAWVVVKNRKHGVDNPLAHLRESVSVEQVRAAPLVAWPLGKLDLPPASDGVCGFVIASAETARRRGKPVAWVQGMAWASDSYWLGERDLASMPSLRIAARQAYDMAGIQDPMRDLDVLEVHDATSYQEILAYEALGLCEPGEGWRLVESGTTARGGTLPVNPSGGVLSSHPPFAAGAVRTAEAALQVMGRAEGRQVEGARRALAHASSGLAAQNNTVFILSSEA